MTRVLNDLANQGLARHIQRVRLASDQHLHRHARVREQPLQTLQVAEQERRALIRSEAPREADGKYLRVEDVLQPLHLWRWRIPRDRAGDSPFPDERDQPALAAPVCLPQLGIRNVGDLIPYLRLGVSFAPVWLKIL